MITQPAALYFVSALGLGSSAVLAYLFYRDFFASDSFPREWNLLLAGLTALILSFISGGVYEVGGSAMMESVALLLRVLGSALLLVAGFILWNKFRL